MIRTVLGDINKEEFGYALAHEHFILDLDHIRHDEQSKIETVEEVIPEIKKAMNQGIQATVEVTTIDMQRDVLKLKKISEQTHLNIVCSTGFYLNEYHPAYLNNMGAEDIAKIYEKELIEGIDNTNIRAGIIAEIASSANGFVGNEKKILEAAGIASKKTGFAVSTHTGKINAKETIYTLLKKGVNPDKIIIGHQDLINNIEYHLSLLKTGVNIGFDTCGKVAYQADETRAKNIVTLIEKGYGEHIVLSNDVSRRTYFTSYGKDGYTAVTSKIVPFLKEYGIKQEDLNKLLKTNVARILDN